MGYGRAGSVVVHDVLDYALVVGCPAKIIGWVDKSGYQMTMIRETDKHIIMYSVCLLYTSPSPRDCS